MNRISVDSQIEGHHRFKYVKFRKSLPASRRTMSTREETMEFFSEIWKISNIQQYINGHTNMGQHNNNPLGQISLSSTAPHFFYIGKNTKNQDKNTLRAQAKLSIDEDTKMVLLTVSLLDREETPSWAVAAKFSTIAIREASGLSFFTYVNLQENTSTCEESNLRTSNCLSPLFHINSVPRYIDQNRDSLTIEFSIWCRITKPKEVHLAKEDLQLCGFQALDDFEALWKDTSTADFEIKVNLGIPRTFHCHKSILAARSPILHAMIASPMKESQESCMEVGDMTADTMEYFLHFLYCGRFQNDSWVQSLPHLIYASDKYCVTSLRQFCSNNLIRSVTCKNAIALADLAQRHLLSKAVSDIRIFIGRNAAQLVLDFEVSSEGVHYMYTDKK